MDPLSELVHPFGGCLYGSLNVHDANLFCIRLTGKIVTFTEQVREEVEMQG